MIEVVQKACDTFIQDFPDFWLTVGAADVSFEAGSSQRYRHAIEMMCRSGCKDQLADRLLLGVNGNLAKILEEQNPDLVPFRGNKQRKVGVHPDVWFGPANSSLETVVEVKALYEMSTAKFYGQKGTHSVADDRAKLEKIRETEIGFSGSLLQAVFFMQLPRYSYPAGDTLMVKGWESWGPRQESVISRTVDEQFARVWRYLGMPVFPKASPPLVRTLPIPCEETATFLKRWCDNVFRPVDPDWQLRPSEHLRDVQVGYAIWSY